MEECGTIDLEPLKISKYKGLRYFIILNPLLGLNGYAELPENWKDGKEEYIEVHGGVTYKGYVRDGKEKVRVIGFDTLHAFDRPEDWPLFRVETECRHSINEIIEVMEENEEETEEEQECNSWKQSKALRDGDL